MHVRNALDYARRRMKELHIRHWRWEEIYVRFPINDPNVTLITKYQQFTTNYWYLLDNWVQPRTFFNTSIENNLQIIGDYSHRRYQGMTRVFYQRGINEFSGRVQFRLELNAPVFTETLLVVPFIEVIPIVAL